MGWVTWVERLIEVAACIEAPAVGCVVGLLGPELLDAIFQYIAGTCKFRKKLAEVLKYVPFVKNLPRRIADFIVEKLIAILPKRAQELIGSPKKDEVDVSEVSGCEDYDEDPDPSPNRLFQKLKPEERALFKKITAYAERDPTPAEAALTRLYEKWGAPPGQPLPAVIHLMHKTGFGIEWPKDAADIQRIDEFIEAVHGDGKAIRKYADSLQPGVEVGDKTLERMLHQAQAFILFPTTRGVVGKHKEPQPEDLAPGGIGPHGERLPEDIERGGITVIRF